MNLKNCRGGVLGVYIVTVQQELKGKAIFLLSKLKT